MPGAVVPRSPSARVVRMHRFTGPTPTSLRGSVPISFVVDGWEIECCGPPPVVGEDVAAWSLQFVPAGPDPSPLDAEHDLRRCPDDRAWVDGAVLAATARCVDGPARGTLFGTVHGGQVPDDLARVRGRVLRIRLLRESFTVVDGPGTRRLVRVPGSLRRTDVRASPRHFAVPALIPGTTGVHETGVLVEVLARPASRAADRRPT